MKWSSNKEIETNQNIQLAYLNKLKLYFTNAPFGLSPEDSAFK